MDWPVIEWVEARRESEAVGEPRRRTVIDAESQDCDLVAARQLASDVSHERFDATDGRPVPAGDED
jgi:hypothetical protein